MKKILVPTDFSRCAGAAADYALYLARKTKAEIHFLHIQTTPVDWVKLPKDKEKLYPETVIAVSKIKGLLEKLKRKAEKNGVSSSVSHIFNVGREEINRYIERGKFDFVVMGSLGADGWKEIMGSNTQRVVRHSKVPVLVVKSAMKRKELRNIVFASWFDEDILPAFRNVEELALCFGAKIHLLFVNTPYYFKSTIEAETDISNFVKSASPKVKFTKNIYNAFDQEVGIQKFSMDMNVNLISVVSHGRKRLRSVFSHSVTESLVNHSQIPVLSVRLWD